ncbi:unnamed protein product, partial [Meganyctiphanes norvegica]
MSHVHKNIISTDEGHYPEEMMRKSVYGICKMNIKEKIEENDEPIKIQAADIELKEEMDINYDPIYFTEGSYFIKKEGSLKGQLRTNIRENPYQCIQCNEAFSYNSNLINHMKTHCGEKLYQCRRCDKAFSNNNSLIKHQRKHTGE